MGTSKTLGDIKDTWWQHSQSPSHKVSPGESLNKANSEIETKSCKHWQVKTERINALKKNKTRFGGRQQLWILFLTCLARFPQEQHGCNHTDCEVKTFIHWSRNSCCSKGTFLLEVKGKQLNLVQSSSSLGEISLLWIFCSFSCRATIPNKVSS